MARNTRPAGQQQSTSAATTHPPADRLTDTVTRRSPHPLCTPGGPAAVLRPERSAAGCRQPPRSPPVRLLVSAAGPKLDAVRPLPFRQRTKTENKMIVVKESLPFRCRIHQNLTLVMNDHNFSRMNINLMSYCIVLTSASTPQHMWLFRAFSHGGKNITGEKGRITNAQLTPHIPHTAQHTTHILSVQ